MEAWYRYIGIHHTILYTSEYAQNFPEKTHIHFIYIHAVSSLYLFRQTVLVKNLVYKNYCPKCSAMLHMHEK